jgi:carboxyl-terminal processing protease
MKNRENKNLILLTKFWAIVIFFALGSCNKAADPTPTTTATTTTTSTNPNDAVNNWIYDTMKTYYYWTDDMPAKAKTDLTLAPETDKTGYFYTLLYKIGVIDRNSWIQKATDLTNSLNGVSTAFGYRNSLYYLDASNTTVGQFVSYVIKGSPIDKAGLVRGDIILKINGTAITNDNYKTLLDFSKTETITFGLGKVENGNFVDAGKSITATKAQVTENPVALSKVIVKGNKKIGYLLYTQFISTYDADLRKVFADFKAQGVNEMVLDLRLNGGGYVSSAQVLGSLIAKNLDPKNIFLKYEYNVTVDAANIKQYGSDYANGYFKAEANNLNLDRLFVLVSGGSASASELIINGLRPFMNVTLIGSDTYGKNEFSQTFTNTKYEWGLQPLLGRSVNSLGQSEYGVTKNGNTWVYQGGFKPDYALKDNVIPFKPFADEGEILFSKALELITGVASKSLRKIADEQTLTLEGVGSTKLQNMSDNPLQNRKEMVIDRK